MKKFIFAIMLIARFAIASPLFAYEGVMAGQKNLRIVQTEYFDIIYAPGSAQSAAILAERADGVYKELTETLNLLHPFRLPLVISPALDTFNAYFSSFPFNHIVLFDTVPPADMMVFTETLMNTFRHELTHAITYNLHNNFWYGVRRVFGDVMNPALLTITIAWAEGAAVSLESAAGEGRVNSEYAMQLLKQAKIEGVFPKYSEIQGARDIYPYTTQSYIFGGAFNYWLQQTYGMQKYAEFWYKCVNFQTLTYFGCFKKVYGFSIRQAWQQFYDSIPIPEGVQVKPQKIKSLSYVGSLTGSTNERAWIDWYSSTVFFSDKEFSGTSLENAGASRIPYGKRLFLQSRLDSVNLSDDGHFLAVIYSDESGANPRNRVFVYDIKKKVRFLLRDKGVSHAAVVRAADGYYLACVQTESERCALNVYRLAQSRRGRITGAELVHTSAFDYGVQPFSLEGDSNGNLYYICKNGMEFSLCRLDVADRTTERWTVPQELGSRSAQKIVLRDLSWDERTGRLFFSYALPGTLPRPGYFTRADGDARFYLADGDVSGGVLCPVLQNGADGAVDALDARAVDSAKPAPENADTLNANAANATPRLDYIASYANGLKVQSVPLSTWHFTEARAVPEPVLAQAALSGNSLGAQASEAHAHAEPDSATAYEVLSQSREFSALSYTFTGKRGALLPLSLASSAAIGGYGDTLEFISVPLGATYASSLPWTSPIYYLSAGYGVLTDSYAARAGIYSGGTTTDLFRYAGFIQAEFDDGGYKQSSAQAAVKSTVPLGGVSYAYASDSFTFFEGWQSNTEYDEDDIKDNEDYIGILNKEKPGQDLSITRLFVQNAFGLGVGNIHKAGKGYFNRAGVQVLPSLSVTRSAPMANLEREYYDFINVSVDMRACIPGALPVVVEAMLFPNDSYVAAGMARLYLVTAELQKSTNFFAILYANRVSLDVSYVAKFKERALLDSWAITKADKYFSHIADGTADYRDELRASVSLYLTPNVGGFARTDFITKLTGSIFFRFYPETEQKRLGVTAGVTLDGLSF